MYSLKVSRTEAAKSSNFRKDAVLASQAHPSPVARSGSEANPELLDAYVGTGALVRVRRAPRELRGAQRDLDCR